MTSDDVRKILKAECDDCGSQVVWATKHSLSPSYTSDVLNGRREPGPALLSALGLRKIVMYRRLA